MFLGIIVILYFAFGIWTIWISKKKPNKIVTRVVFTFLTVILAVIISSFTFSPKSSFYVKSFPFQLDREYTETIEVDGYVIVVYTDNDNDSYKFETFYKFLIAYVEDSSIKPKYRKFEVDEPYQTFWLIYTTVNDQDYLLLFNEDLKDYESLIIGGQVINTDVNLTQKYSLVVFESNIDDIETVTLNDNVYNLEKIE